ncbi:hypothetical protein CANINC_003749 [Pichia inconspicua]|uniref:Mediator of RNA polymerase II transcription subunit 14 n=1 Tax=Pichia inconspicua TaxID=52247 RepID=A0A4T0WZ93_9ASCO|nr:hypothetical protein CANINC_003749 [[Candida] inconspicua]
MQSDSLDNRGSDTIGVDALVIQNGMPPELPHVMMNMTPLNLILDRIATDAFSKLKEYFKFMESDTVPELKKKKQLLDLLVSIRENFVRLYVLCKWARTHEKISKLIDLFVWLREQNQHITNVIMSFGAIKSSLISSKLPEPDLLTSLEVLLQGRPDLPTYNFIPEEKLSPEFVLKVLKNLNVELSIKMALDDSVPKAFKVYEIKNGCVYFNVINNFTCSISTLDGNGYYLIDFSLGFALDSNVIKPTTQKLDNASLHALQKYSNKILFKKKLEGLYQFLYNYSVTAKIYLIHKCLVNLRMGLWRGHLSHTYNSESSLITISYWLQRKSFKQSTIQIGKFSDSQTGRHSLSFKWFLEGKEITDHKLELYDVDGTIDIVKLINNIINLHIQTIILKLKENLIATVENIEKMIDFEGPNKFIFRITPFKHLAYCIDKLSGSCYFENPTNLMNVSSFKINTGKSTDFVEILRLKMLIKETEFTSMMNATGWVPLVSVRLKEEESAKLEIDYSNLKNKAFKHVLTSILTYRRKDWPIGWAVCVGHFGFQSNVQLWCCKIKSVEGQWIMNWNTAIHINELSEDVQRLQISSSDADTEIVETKSMMLDLSYQDLANLVKLSSSKLISNLLVRELKEAGCQLKVLNTNDRLVNEFLSKNFNIVKLSTSLSDNAVLLIRNQSLFHIQNASDSLVLLISIKNSELNAKIYGRLIDDLSSEKIPKINYKDENGISIEYDKNTRIFKIESMVDLSKQIGLVSGGYNSSDSSILSNILLFLRKFTRSLNLLKIVSNDPKLTIVDVLPNGVKFTYGEKEEESITLRISTINDSEIILELPPENPHYPYLNYLNKIINNAQIQQSSIKELVSYLTLTLNYCKSIHSLVKESEQELDIFKKSNQDIDLRNNAEKFQLLPNTGFVPSISNLEKFRIMYFKSVKFDFQSMNGKKRVVKNVADIFKFEISIELRHRSSFVSKKNSKFLISLGGISTENTGVIRAVTDLYDTCGATSNFTGYVKKVLQTISQYFEGSNFPFVVTKGSVVFLKDGICCDFDSIDQVLNDLHHRLYSLVRETL